MFVAWDAKSILIDMFALLLINDIDEYVGSFYMKYEVQSNEEGHVITCDDDWLKFDFTVFQNEVSYMCNKTFQFFWLTIIVFNYGTQLIPGFDLTDYNFLYGFQPSQAIIMKF